MRRRYREFVTVVLLLVSASCVPPGKTLSDDILGYYAPTNTVGSLAIFTCSERQYFISQKDFTRYSGIPYRLGMIIRSPSITTRTPFPIKNLVLMVSVYNCTTKREDYSGVVYWPSNWEQNQKRTDEHFAFFLVYKDAKLAPVTLSGDEKGDYLVSVTVLHKADPIMNCRAFLAVGRVIFEPMPID